jgi:C4-dicarboxylate-specific signal transduction histidine kinase
MDQSFRPLPTRTVPPPPASARAVSSAEPSRSERDAGLALIGRISAGLAQELGNSLGIAAMNLDVVRAEYDRLSREGHLGPSALGPALLDLESSVLRMQAVLANLRPFATGAAVDLAPVPVADVVGRVVRWARRALRGIDVEVCADPAAALADPTMLEHIVLELTENAAEAASLLPWPRVRYHVYRSGDRVVVSVRDNGPGVTRELHETIFEPFFTTRRGEGGAGLGLTLCREYARQMGASLTMSSAPGEGACFRLSLPGAVYGSEPGSPLAAQ